MENRLQNDLSSHSSHFPLSFSLSHSCKLEATFELRSIIGQGVSFHISSLQVVTARRELPELPSPRSPSFFYSCDINMSWLCVLCCLCCCSCLLSLSTQICFDFNPAYALVSLLHATAAAATAAGHATGLPPFIAVQRSVLPLVVVVEHKSAVLALPAEDDDYAP